MKTRRSIPHKAPNFPIEKINTDSQELKLLRRKRKKSPTKARKKADTSRNGNNSLISRRKKIFLTPNANLTPPKATTSRIVNSTSISHYTPSPQSKLSGEVFNDSFVDSLMYWRYSNPPGSGFKNLGNTCFLNSVLQCILYTAPLKNYFYFSDHSMKCNIPGVCFICEYGKLSKMTEGQKSPITPQNIIQNIKNIAYHIKIGRQEDAHEFLLYFISAMEISSAKYAMSIHKKYTKMKKLLEEDNLIQKIFGGKIVSEVKCGKCKNVSSKVDKFSDISLEISNCSTLYESFEHFCKVELLTGNNKYFCEKCKQRNESTKQLSFEKFPRILVIHLKRFDNSQRKIKKFIQYSTEYDLSPFKTSSVKVKGEKPRYKLTAVLIHDGNTIDSGHYYCYARASNNSWYYFNDSTVMKVDANKVLQLTPYLLFYERVLDKGKVKVKNDTATTISETTKERITTKKPQNKPQRAISKTPPKIEKKINGNGSKRITRRGKNK